MQLHGSHGVKVLVLNLLCRDSLKSIDIQWANSNLGKVQLELVLFSISQSIFSFNIALDYVILNDSLNILYWIWSWNPSWLLAYGCFVLEPKSLLSVLVSHGVLISVSRDLLSWTLKIEEVLLTEASMPGKTSKPAQVCATDSCGLSLTAMKLGDAGHGRRAAQLLPISTMINWWILPLGNLSLCHSQDRLCRTMWIDPLCEAQRLFVMATSISLLCILGYTGEANCGHQAVNHGGHADFIAIVIGVTKRIIIVIIIDSHVLGIAKLSLQPWRGAALTSSLGASLLASARLCKIYHRRILFPRSWAAHAHSLTSAELNFASYVPNYWTLYPSFRSLRSLLLNFSIVLNINIKRSFIPQYGSRYWSLLTFLSSLTFRLHSWHLIQISLIWYKRIMDIGIFAYEALTGLYVLVHDK